MSTLCTLTGEGFAVVVTQDDDGRVHFTSDADIDADGAPHAYHMVSKWGLDDLENAKDNNGRFVGVLTDSRGKPVAQGSDDPAPGFLISTTTYEHRDEPEVTQRRYLNAETVPFIVVSPLIRQRAKGIVLGCRARARMKGGEWQEAMVGDIGPRFKVGEVSIALARLLGIPSSPRTGGEDSPIVEYELYPGTPAVLDGVTYELQPA